MSYPLCNQLPLLLLPLSGSTSCYERRASKWPLRAAVATGRDRNPGTPRAGHEGPKQQQCRAEGKHNAIKISGRSREGPRLKRGSHLERDFIFGSGFEVVLPKIASKNKTYYYLS